METRRNVRNFYFLSYVPRPLLRPSSHFWHRSHDEHGGRGGEGGGGGGCHLIRFSNVYLSPFLLRAKGTWSKVGHVLAGKSASSGVVRFKGIKRGGFGVEWSCKKFLRLCPSSTLTSLSLFWCRAQGMEPRNPSLAPLSVPVPFMAQSSGHGGQGKFLVPRPCHCDCRRTFHPIYIKLKNITKRHWFSLFYYFRNTKSATCIIKSDKIAS